MALGDLVNSDYAAIGSGDSSIIIPWTPTAGNTIVLAIQRIEGAQDLTPTGYTQFAAVEPIQGTGNGQHTVWNDGWWAHGQLDTTIEITQDGDEGKLAAIWEIEGEVEPYLTDEQSWPDRGCSGPWTMTVGELDVDRPTVLLGASVLRFAQTAVMAPGDVVPTDGVESEPGTEGDVLHPMWAGYERVEAGFHLWEIVVQDPAVGADCLRGQSAWLAAFDVSGPTPPVTPPLVCAVDDTDLSELVCIDAEDLVDWKIRVELQGTGSGYIVIHRSHLAADTDVIKKGNWLAVKIPQIDDEAIFVFQMERITTTLISADEGGGETLQVAGRGNLSYFDRAIALPRTYASGSGESDLSVDGIINGPAATGNKAGQVLERAMREWQHVDRGVSDFGLRLEPIAHITHDFDYDDDSGGDPWDTTDMTGELSLGYVGEKGLVGILELIGTGAIDIIMWPTFLLQAFNQFGRDLTGGSFATDVVRFVRGVNIAEQLVRDEGLVVDPTHTVVQGSDGTTTAWAFAESPVYGSQPHVEGHVSTFGTDNTALEAVGVAEMARRIRHGESIQFRVATPRFGTDPDPENGLYLPGPEGTNGNYWLGDFVTLHTGSGFRDYADLSVRVMAITITTDEAGDLEVTAELKGTTLTGRLIPQTGSFGSFGGGGGSLGGSGAGGTGGSSAPPPPAGSGVAKHVADPDDAHDGSAISLDGSGFTTLDPAIDDVQEFADAVDEALAGTSADGAYTVEPQTPHQSRHFLQRDGTWRDPFITGLGTVDSVGSAVTITDDTKYNAWPTICRLTENRVILAYTKGDSHHGDNTGKAVVKIGTEDGTGTISWGSEITAYDHATLWASAMGVARISTGRLFITLWRDNHSDADSGEAGVVYSDDDGATWSAWISLSIGRDAEYGAGAVVELPDGDLLVPVEGHDVVGDTPLDNDSFTLRSTDHGETWGGAVLVHDFDSDSIPCYESCLVLLDNDVLQIYHRTGASSGSTVKRQESLDFGLTWGAMSDAWTGYGKANVIQDSTGVLWAVERQTGTADVILFSSIDRGVTWDAGTVVTTAPFEMEYGCPLESLRTGRLIIVWGDQPTSSTSNADIDYAIVVVDVGEFSGGVTVEDEGTPLATSGTTLDFVGAGVTASGTGAQKTITISGAPAGAAGGDLSGTYPNPSVVDDSHNHTSATVSAGGPILISDDHSTPILFADILLTEEGDDILYADSW